MFKVLGMLALVVLCGACSPKKPQLILEQDQSLIVPPEIDLLPNAENMDIPQNGANIFNN